MDGSLLFTIILILGVGILLLGFLMFGQATLETVVALLRIGTETTVATFRLLGSSILALSWYAIGGLVLVVAVCGWLVYIYWLKPGNLNSLLYRIPVCTELFDRNGEVIDYICPFSGVRLWRPMKSIDPKLRSLIVMLEDDKFYEHGGLDVDEILNAIEEDLEHKKLKRGASTITQQLAKNLFLTKDKNFLRKFFEVPLAFRLEREFEKDELIELYMNVIEWGPGVFGVEAASRLYFDHPAEKLSDEEAWLLALMIPNPTVLNLWVSSKGKKSILFRARHLANRLASEHRMSKEESQKLLTSFGEFLNKWEELKPKKNYSQRRFPLRWSLNRTFRLSEIVSIRRKTAGALGSFTQSQKVASFLDRKIQEQLEQSVDNTFHVDDMGDVITLMDHEQIRAIGPIAAKSELSAGVLELARRYGLKPHVFSARKIPASSLWP